MTQIIKINTNTTTATNKKTPRITFMNTQSYVYYTSMNVCVFQGINAHLFNGASISKNHNILQHLPSSCFLMLIKNNNKIRV